MAIDKVMAIDVGNTHTVIGLFEGLELRHEWRITSGLNRTEDEFGALLNYLMRLREVPVREISGVALSSVVPDLTFGIARMSQKYFNRSLFQINSGIDLGMKILYKNPAAVGADRLCNAVAAKEKYGMPLVIVDFGTATTFDCVNTDGDYVGGLIAPGIQTSISALHARAAKLPLVDMEFPDKLIGTTTEESIQSGILFGAVGMLEGLAAKLKRELGADCKIIATGGLADRIAEQTRIIDAVDHHLCLEGIVKLYYRNHAKQS